MLVSVEVDEDEVLSNLDDDDLLDEIKRRGKPVLAGRAYQDLRGCVTHGWSPPQSVVDYFWHAYGWSL